jgi:beta-glucosidase-like glycosyl hydrolase
MTDSMKMLGITNFAGSPGEGVVRALEAGADLILCATIDMYDAAVEAMENGRIPASRIEESYARVLKLKQKLAKQPDSIFRDKNVSDEEQAALRIGQSITWLRKPESWAPLNSEEQVAAFSSWKVLLDELIRTAGDRLNVLQVFDLKNNPYHHYQHAPKADYDKVTLQTMLTRTREGQTVIFGTDSAEGLEMAARLKENGRKVWVIHGGKVCLAEEAPAALDTILLNYSRTPIACRKAAEVLFGRIPARGKLPAPY